MAPLPLLLLALALAGPGARATAPPGAADSATDPHARIRGMTVSCQTWGWEWGSPGFAEALDDLAGLGANWVAIHPYAHIRGDGTVSWRAFDPESPPEWLAGPVRVAREHGFAILIKPHLSYWGSPFSWRGAIHFDDPAARARFWETYSEWIVAVARATRGAAAFAVGTELDEMLGDEAQWRDLIERVRAVTDARLTYAANWSDYQRVPFWDALDAVGVQAYFPLVGPPPEQAVGATAGAEGAPGADAGPGPESEPAPGTVPDEATLRAGWERALQGLRAVHERTGKPVVFTELGYDVSREAALEPWKEGRVRGADRAAAEQLQERCFRVAFEVLDEEQDWLRGAFLWKWFVGRPHRHDQSFYVDVPRLRALLARAWARAPVRPLPTAR